MNYTTYNLDCRDALDFFIPDNSVDAIITDPPYGLNFMGKKWDYDVPGVDVWEKCLRALKPGGHLLSFAGTRTHHRMAVRIEDAGFEIRDMIAWVYGSGFPKSLDVSKAIDKAAGAEREVVGFDPVAAKRTAAVGTAAYGDYKGQTGDVSAPATDAARQWDGWGTALKPALEPITVARKPLVGTVAANVLAHGTGAINIDGCRVGDDVRINAGMSSLGVMHDDNWQPKAVSKTVSGRWPANLIHDGGEFLGEPARFFYCAKASKADRGDCNNHPTVKPTDLMRHLCRLVTPPGGVIFDPFMGSGSTGKAALLEGFRFIGCELSDEYTAIANARLEAALK